MCPDISNFAETLAALILNFHRPHIAGLSGDSGSDGGDHLLGRDSRWGLFGALPARLNHEPAECQRN
jgi:hypothetical protein